MNDITALVLTYNEQDNISRTLDAISWIRRVVVVDSYSTDQTVKLTAGYPNVTLFQRQFDTHTDQWNFGLGQVETPWVLALDADYQLSEGLVAEIQALTPDDDVAGYEARFEYRIFGQPLRASVYPPHIVLFRRVQGCYEADGHTQALKIDGKLLTLRSPIYHDDRKPLSRWIQSQDGYAKLEAKHLLEVPVTNLKFQDRLRLRIYFAPVVMFFYLLIRHGLILYGWRGWYYTAQRVIAELLLSIRIIEERHKVERPK